jgi:regulator of protease activity HflC (stomatin/prohibitin superfamily)
VDFSFGVAWILLDAHNTGREHRGGHTLESIDITQTLLLIASIVLAACLVAGIVAWLGYWGPRSRAFKSGERAVLVWFGLGKLLLWNPGETFVFQENKKLKDVGDAQGGMRTIFPIRGEECVGPIPLRTGMLDWEDPRVLTREAQPLDIKVAVWWKVDDARTYAFRISTDTPQAGKTTASHNRLLDDAAVHNTVERWIRVLTEAAVRSEINQLSVADVVSAQATQFLQDVGENGRPQRSTELGELFEPAMDEALKTIKEKAKGYGIDVERLEVQHVHLPKQIQEAINETRIAFLSPIKTEREAEAAKIKLEKLVQVLGKDTVGLNELMKNLQGAQIVAPFNFLAPLFAGLDKRAASALSPTSPENPPKKELPEGGDQVA